MEKELVDTLPISLFAKFNDAMLTAHEHAVEKHPMSGFHNDSIWSAGHDATLDLIRNSNNVYEQNRHQNWYYIFEGEVLEALKEIAEGNYTAAQAELVQMAQVAFRAWLWCEQISKERGECSDYEKGVGR